MSQYILINKVHVQDANCIAGLTWGFPSITGFTGFAHALALKVKNSEYSKINISNQIMVVAHDYHHHTYENDFQITRFSQKRGANFYSNTEKDKHSKTMTRIEEGRMDMTVSLLIPIQGRVGANSKKVFIDYLNHCLSTMRIAGGSVIDIKYLDVLSLDNSNKGNQIFVRRRLMPGYVLMDASNALKQQYDNINSSDSDLIDTWLDFSCIKRKARPVSNLISKYFDELSQSDNEKWLKMAAIWQSHLDQPYEKNLLPNELKQYFSESQESIPNSVFQQWLEYSEPNSETQAKWEYVPKPQGGYLVPIMNGYRRISEDVSDIDSLRGIASTPEQQGDFENAYFVEAIYGVAEWVFARRLNFENFSQYFWQPKHCNEQGMYTCVMPQNV